ncbi:MAG: efflux RND transporter periplasmic adaptor subunit [Planctomycetes bacterium]|nr:efflux RND transporter periplasmic adaptor subunit [Planctomycetota bacterium]
MRITKSLLVALLMSTPTLPGCDRQHGGPEHAAEAPEHAEHAIGLTSPVKRDVTITQAYVCRIRSCRHVEIRSLASGYLEPIAIKEGQRVSAGDLLFKIFPAVYQARLEAERAEAQAARIECANTRKLVESNVVSTQELALAEAKLGQAEARARLAEVELNFTSIRAPFDGIIDRFELQHGSYVDEGELLTTLSDNSLMWVYFNVPEARYLEYIAEGRGSGESIELVLANGQTFPQRGSIGAIEADFDNKTGNIAFRADFPNPAFLLRNGQTGKVLMRRTVPGALVIPQRATFTVLAKRFVFVVGEDGVVHQREIVIDHELEDVFVVRSGLTPEDRIVLEGVAQVRDGEKPAETEFRAPEEALKNLKFYAE